MQPTPEHPKSKTVCERITQMFTEHGIRCTRQRVALYEALASTEIHPTADQLYQMVSACDDEQHVSLATVYNTLEAFCEAGLVQKIACKGGSVRYDATTSNHLHLRDQCSGAVADVPEDLSKLILEQLPADVLKRLETKMGFKINQVQIEFLGSFEKPCDKQE
jgi:Fe2+ or Zn2+ uptake regulation protein